MAEGFFDFTPGQVLTAAQVDDYLMRQAVMRFDDASARTTALSGVLVEGMMSYLKDTNTVEVYDGSAWVGVGGANYGTATGGSSSTITVGGESWTLLTFTSSGTLTVTDAGLFDVLIVGGGGGGGQAGLTTGGGGAGGYREFSQVYFDSNQTVTIGAGGAVNGRRGSSSVCGDVFCAGGGGGGRVNLEGDNGASGGGMGYATGSAYGRGDGVTGNDGGLGVAAQGGGGGGGAGSVGSANSGASGGAGGTGADASTFRGESAGTTYYSAGGTGSSTSGANGSAGGANTGDGGGGSDGGTAGAGGSGIVLVRFKN